MEKAMTAFLSLTLTAALLGGCGTKNGAGSASGGANATDLHREALFATGVVLFVFILLINLCFSCLKRKGERG